MFAGVGVLEGRQQEEDEGDGEGGQARCFPPLTATRDHPRRGAGGHRLAVTVFLIFGEWRGSNTSLVTHDDPHWTRGYTQSTETKPCVKFNP